MQRLILFYFRLHKSQEDEHGDDLEKECDRDTERPRNGSVLNLSAQAQSDLQEGSASSDPGRASDSDIGEPEADIGSETEDMELGKQQEKEAGTGTPGNMFQMMNQIQSLIKMTVEKAKQEEKNNSNQKCDKTIVINTRFFNIFKIGRPKLLGLFLRQL